MKAYKIDVISKEVREIELQPGIKAIYKELDCDTFTVVSIGKIDIYVDDEGLCRDEPLGAFSIRGYHQVLSGHGLVVSTDDEGDSIGPVTPIEIVRENVRFEDTYYLPEPSMTFIPLD
jgi:hypothetical protein